MPVHGSEQANSTPHSTKSTVVKNKPPPAIFAIVMSYGANNKRIGIRIVWKRWVAQITEKFASLKELEDIAIKLD